jgi:hypothetical protein
LESTCFECAVISSLFMGVDRLIQLRNSQAGIDLKSKAWRHEQHASIA